MFALANASNLNEELSCQDARNFILALWLKHCTALEIPLACLAPEGLSSHVGTIHYSYSSPLLLLSTLEANTQAILFV